MPTAITIDQIVKSYGGAGAPAVDGVSLSIKPGELFFLLGPSGCGKTTLLRMIAGFIEPTGGRVLFATGDGQGERDVTHLAPNLRNTGMVFQSYALWPHMTVAKNVAFGLEVRKVARAEIERRVKEALDVVQMGHLSERKPNALSGGQQQRVALARALVVRPDVLLLDEPLSNLDAKLRVELRGEIRRICKAAGITTVYVTHDQKEALSMADMVAIMQSGKVVQLGRPGDLYRAPANRFVAEFLGETNFIEGTVENTGTSGSTIRTPFGMMTSSHSAPAGLSAGAAVLVSLRPEALRVTRGNAAGSGDGANMLTGTLLETTYLGELSLLVVELRGGGGGMMKVKAAVLNPGVRDDGSVGQPVGLAVMQEDVVLVPRG
ncbi:MAG: ABC transporter ATP-binding protein [Phycisphaerales bacterium]|nr:ABC transporter ATP-binding protein [Phycisphaerales bacterium]